MFLLFFTISDTTMPGYRPGISLRKVFLTSCIVVGIAIAFVWVLHLVWLVSKLRPTRTRNTPSLHSPYAWLNSQSRSVNYRGSSENDDVVF